MPLSDKELDKLNEPTKSKKNEQSSWVGSSVVDDHASTLMNQYKTVCNDIRALYKTKSSAAKSSDMTNLKLEALENVYKALTEPDNVDAPKGLPQYIQAQYMSLRNEPKGEKEGIFHMVYRKITFSGDRTPQLIERALMLVNELNDVARDSNVTQKNLKTLLTDVSEQAGFSKLNIGNEIKDESIQVPDYESDKELEERGFHMDSAHKGGGDCPRPK